MSNREKESLQEQFHRWTLTIERELARKRVVRTVEPLRLPQTVPQPAVREMIRAEQAAACSREIERFLAGRGQMTELEIAPEMDETAEELPQAVNAAEETAIVPEVEPVPEPAPETETEPEQEVQKADVQEMIRNMKSAFATEQEQSDEWADTFNRVFHVQPEKRTEQYYAAVHQVVTQQFGEEVPHFTEAR